MRGNPMRLGAGAVSNTNSDSRPKGRRTTTLSVASLNSRGLQGSRRENRSKLASAVRVMRDSKWGLLGIQETHESQQAAITLEATNPKVWAFPNPGTAFSAGTILVIHREFFPYKAIKPEDIVHTILIPGRAQLLTLPWRQGENIDIVNIYAPNDQGEAIRFFKQLRTKLRRHPDIVMGDFNHVENMIDRIPQRDTERPMKDALADFRIGLGLTDGWRLNNPGTHSYTWTCASTTTGQPTYRSRLDRILTSRTMTNRAARWGHQTSQNISDHDFVFTDLIDERDPEMGTSRWKMSAEQLSNAHLEQETLKILIKADSEMRSGKDAMRAWLKMKQAIKRVFSEEKRSLTKQRSSRMKNLENERDNAKAHPDYTRSTQIQRNCESIEQRIAEIKEQKTAAAVVTQTARYRTLGESVSKYWFSIGKSLMTESMIRSLRDEDGVSRPNTEAILEIAARHHEKLMANPPMSTRRTKAIEEMVELAKRNPLTPAKAALLGAAPTTSEAGIAIQVSQTGKAPGEDGITYEFYKKWKDAHERAEKEGEKKIPSITEMMVKAWNAPSKKEEAQAEYVKGLMALLYKKGDKEDPANYRPITLLNTDEKLETKVLATKMGLALPSIIHPDQAGFVPGRDILDHVKLAKIVSEYCEITEQDGCLVALDQEKAYDRIDHKYLWEIMNGYGIPETFIQRVQSLYANATTEVMVNRSTSRAFQIKRGVRQGDPMSCLLFDLAIEPLAVMLRDSTLRGIKIPGRAERLICRLFADDTQLYLGKKDSFREAMEIAERWTTASTAKFNEAKTEVLPIGTAKYRQKVVSTRRVAGKVTQNDTEFPQGARVIKTGESLRILGGRIGYNLDTEEVWQPILDKMAAAAKKWAARSLTMKGRSIVSSFLILSLAQYPMMVNEPSTQVIKRVNQILRPLVWKNKTKGILKLELLSKPVEQGGIGIPLFEARTRAARIMWLKKWRKPHIERPDWTNFLDRMIKHASKTQEKPWMNSYLDQTWKTRKKLLTKETRNLLKEAETSNLTVDALKMGKRPKRETIIWRSSDTNASAKQENSAEARRLWKTHSVNTQAGLMRILAGTPTNCKSHKKCLLAAERLMLRIAPKSNILEETPRNRWTGLKDNLDLTNRRRDANVLNRALGNPIILDPNVTHQEARVLATRVFAPPREAKAKIAYRQTNLNVQAGTAIVYTDGSADRNGYDNSACGAGLWSTEHGCTGSYRIPGYPPTNNRGELAAATIALEKAPLNKRLIIRTDSMYVLNFLDGGFKKIEDSGWLNTPNADLLKRCLYLLRRRTAETLMQKVKAHSGEEGNEAADEAAKAGAAMTEMYDIQTDVPEQWALQGARLGTLPFHDAYEWGRKSLETEISERAEENLKKVADHMEAKTQNKPSAAAIWLSLRDRDIRREISDFLWQAMHGRTVCGPFFRHWGGEWTEKQYCRCGAMETLEHILCGCQTREWRTTLWDEFKNIAKKSKALRARQVDIPGYEDILAVGLHKNQYKDQTRIYKILLTETAFIIWKMRNEEVIREERINPARAKAALHAALAKRAEIDLAAARLRDNPQYNRKNFERTVKATWAGLVSRLDGKLIWIASDHG